MYIAAIVPLPCRLFQTLTGHHLYLLDLSIAARVFLGVVYGVMEHNGQEGAAMFDLPLVQTCLLSNFLQL